MILQRTLRRQISVQGIGLHSGTAAELILKPAPTQHGIVFARTDLDGSPRVPAHYKNVINTQLATTLGVGKVTISTVEHVLAALQGLGIDNVLVEVNGPEVPIMDGSSRFFVQAILDAGVQTQMQTRPLLVLRRRIELKLNEKWAVAEPSSRLEIHGSIEWDHPAVGYQECHYIDGKSQFSDLASARTFCFFRDVEAMQARGLARGGSLDNAVVMDETRVLNPEGLRYPNELARHKVLDALGDFKLAGIAIQAYVRLHRAGHDLHSKLLTEIFRDPDNFEIIDSQVREERISRPRNIMVGAGLAANF